MPTDASNKEPALAGAEQRDERERCERDALIGPGLGAPRRLT